MYPVSEQVPSKQEKKALLDDMIEEMKTKYQRLVEHPEEREDADELNRRYSVVKNRATLIVAVDLFRSYELAIAYNERGQLFYRMIEFDKAVEDYTEAIKYCGALAAPYYNRGTIRYRMGEAGRRLARGFGLTGWVVTVVTMSFFLRTRLFRPRVARHGESCAAPTEQRGFSEGIAGDPRAVVIVDSKGVLRWRREEI